VFAKYWEGLLRYPYIYHWFDNICPGTIFHVEKFLLPIKLLLFDKSKKEKLSNMLLIISRSEVVGRFCEHKEDIQCGNDQPYSRSYYEP
jgi:hypothetical protein